MTKQRVLGSLKWFTVGSEYSFINSNDTRENMFAHQTRITRINPYNIKRSVVECQTVEFDVVAGGKGLYTPNVYAPDREPVQSSPYVVDRRRFWSH